MPIALDAIVNSQRGVLTDNREKTLEGIVKDQGGTLRDLEHRRHDLMEAVATAIIRLFGISVVGTIVLTGALVAIDTHLLSNKLIAPSDRLVTERVLIAIIGASVVQVGAAIVAIVTSVFKKAGKATA